MHDDSGWIAGAIGGAFTALAALWSFVTMLTNVKHTADDAHRRIDKLEQGIDKRFDKLEHAIEKVGEESKTDRDYIKEKLDRLVERG